MSKFLDSTGLSYFWGKVKSYLMRRNLVPEQSKTYTGVIAPGNSDPAGFLYYGAIKPVNYNTPWRIKLRIHATIAGLSSNQYSRFELEVFGIYNTYYGWDAFNASNASYRSIYQYLLYTCTATGITNGYGHMLGVRLYSAYKPTTAANSRTFNIDILETENCEFEFFDNMILYANAPGTGSTNYNARYSFDATTAGHKMYGDANTQGYYMFCYNYVLAKTNITAESLIVGDSDGYSRVGSGVSFDLSYPILWCTVNVNAGGDDYIHMFTQHYDRNIATGAKAGFTSSKNKVIYLVVTVSGNIATIDSDIISDEIPQVDNDKVYIMLGRMGNRSTGANYFIFLIGHPMFWYKNGEVRTYPDQGHTIESDVPSGAKFTDTTYDIVSTSEPGLAPTRTGTTTKFLRDDATWANPNEPVEATVTRGSMINASDTIWCRKQGSVAIVDYACRFSATAATYGTSDYLCTFSIKPAVATHGVFMLGSATKVVRVDTSGHLFFNGSTAVTASQWMIGQMVFPLAE